MRILSIIFIFLLSLVIVSCEFEEADIQYNLGNDFINDPSTVIMIDTMSVYTYTTSVDSFETSRANRFLIGSATSPFNISTYCESYLCFDISNFAVFHSTAMFDSVCLVLSRDGYSYGDTTMAANFGIYKLSEKIEVDEETGFVYNKTTYNAESDPMGTFTIDFSGDDREIVAKLDSAFGAELFNLTVNDDEQMLYNDLFDTYFNGFVIKQVDDQAKFVAGLVGDVDSTLAPKIRIYYHDFTISDDLYFDFPIESIDNFSSGSRINYRSYNRIENSYAGTSLEGKLKEDAFIPSTQTEDVSFLQAGSMLRTKIEIPGIDELYSLGIGSIVRAELEFEPIKGTFHNLGDLPALLQMSVVDEKDRPLVDENNNLKDRLYSAGTTNEVFGRLLYNDEFKTQTKYTFDITNFVISEYENRTDARNSMIMNIPYNSEYPNLGQLVIGNKNNVDHKMKLKIYITNY